MNNYIHDEGFMTKCKTWWRLRWAFFSRVPTIHWPYKHARLQNNDLCPPLPTQTPSSPLPSLRPTPLRSDEEIQADATMAARDGCVMWLIVCVIGRGTYAVYSTHLSDSAVKQTARTSWVTPLLTYYRVPAELNDTARIESIRSQGHCNVNTVGLVIYRLLLFSEVDATCV